MNPIFDMLAKLLPHAMLQPRPWNAIPGNYMGHQATPSHRKRITAGCNNHGQGEPKHRVKMAARSNRINRQRCRRWNHA